MCVLGGVSPWNILTFRLMHGSLRLIKGNGSLYNDQKLVGIKWAYGGITHTTGILVEKDAGAPLL